MGDLFLRVSLLIQRGFVCRSCGTEIDGEVTGAPRVCASCREQEDSPTNLEAVTSG